MSDDRSDEVLVEDFVRRGDRGAFELLVSRHQTRIYNLCLRYLGSTVDAEDVTQEIFISLIDKLKAFKGRSRFSTWLYSVSANKCKDYIRSRKNTNELNEEVLPPGASSETEALDRIGEEKIVRAIKQLPGEFRMAVVLRDIQGLTYEEIALALGISKGTVKSRISRGRRMVGGFLG